VKWQDYCAGEYGRTLKALAGSKRPHASGEDNAVAVQDTAVVQDIVFGQGDGKRVLVLGAGACAFPATSIVHK
jgi:hypothetical protein